MNKEIISTIQSCKDKDPIYKWETLKVRIKKMSNDYSKARAKLGNIVIAQLSEIVNNMEQRLPLEKEEYDLLDKTKLELEEKMEEKARGIMFRSKVRWYEMGEKSTKYFFSLRES